MDLNMNSLSEKGGFVGPPVKKEIEWEQDGEMLKATTYVRKLSYKSVYSDVHADGQADLIVAGRIAACICDAEGKPVFSAGDITGDVDPQRGALSHNLTVALLNAIAEVNSLGKQEA